MKVNVSVNGVGWYMIVPNLYLVTIWVGQKIGAEIAKAELCGNKIIEIKVRIEVNE